MNVRRILHFAAVACMTMTAAGATGADPTNDTRAAISLDGTWQIIFDRENVGKRRSWHQPEMFAKETSRPITVPSCWEQFEQDYEGVAYYRRAFKVPANWAGKTIRLHFDAVNFRSEVWLNDTDALWHHLWQSSLDFARGGVMTAAMSGLDVAQPDLAYCGGISEVLKIRTLATALGVSVVPHVWGTMFNLAAAVHFLAATFVEPGRMEAVVPLLERDRTPHPLRDELFDVPVEITGGTAHVPERPGLGVKVNRLALKKYLVKETENA